MRRVALAATLLTLFCVAPAANASNDARIVIITLPGITWNDVRTAHTPAIDAIVERGATAALATRTAVAGPNPDRGYLTLGAGNRAFLASRRGEPFVPDPRAQAAYMASDAVEGGTGAEALRRRVGDTRPGDVVHLGIGYLQARQAEGLYNARIGLLGESLERAGIASAVVSAADISPSPDSDGFRRAAVTSIADADGTVDTGALHGLVVPDAGAPFGARTDVNKFAQAVRRALDRAAVVVAEPGETLRADEFSALTAIEAVPGVRRRALERADAIVGAVGAVLPRNATLMLVGVSPPSYRLESDRLTPIVMTGPGVKRGWLTSPTTRRPGQVTLTDVAPTVLAVVGAAVPEDMVGRPISSVSYGGPGREAELDELDRASVFREAFAALVFWITATLLSLLSVGAAVAFWRRRAAAYPWLVGVTYFGLAIFPAAHMLRTLEYWRFGHVGAHAALYGLAGVLAFVASRVPGPRLAGVVALLLVSAANLAADGLMTGPLQVNGVWGHSPVVAGRFYGISNVGSTILFCGAILGLTGLCELRRQRVAPVWVGAVLAAIVGVIGLAQFGADFGGLLTGVVAVAVVMRLARGRRIDWRWVTGVLVLAVVLTAAATILDLLRAPQTQTHLGRFGDVVATGGLGTIGLIVKRKVAAQFGSLATTRWTYFVPLGVGLVAYLLAAPRGVLRQALERRPILRAGFWGVLVVAVLGFAVNDSGISITATAVAHAIPILILLAVDEVAPRKRALAA